ncbi:MAG: DUF6056 family protein [Lachnospiraceae bacterium]|nr:DUF6056 family protein [Lachnospiraceae bacterium]
MSMDDVGYATSAEKIWEETHSVLKVFAAQFSYAWDYWKSWQGTFAAEWLCTSLMGIFQKSAYYMGTYIALTGFVFTELFLFLVILMKVFHADFFRSCIISAGVICLQILLTPYPVEAFYWFCGAVLYTCPYNEAMLLCGMLILLYYHPSKLWQRLLLYTEIILMTILVSGGTYITLIGMLCVYFLIAAWFWFRRNSEKYFVTVSAVLYLTGFLVNVLAPGNQARLSTVSDAADASALIAILRSFKEAGEYIAVYSTPPRYPACAAVSPAFCQYRQKEELRLSFPCSGHTGFLLCVRGTVYPHSLYPWYYRRGKNSEHLSLDLLHMVLRK